MKYTYYIFSIINILFHSFLSNAQTTVELITSNQNFSSGSSSGWTSSGSTFFVNTQYSSCHSCPGYVAMPVSNTTGQGLVNGTASLKRLITIPNNVIANSSGSLNCYLYISTYEVAVSTPYDVLTIGICFIYFKYNKNEE